METLLGEESQSKATTLCMSVRKLIPEDYIVEEESLFRCGIQTEGLLENLLRPGTMAPSAPHVLIFLPDMAIC